MIYSILLLSRYYKDIQDIQKGVYPKFLLINTLFLYLIDTLWFGRDKVISLLISKIYIKIHQG